MNCPSRNDSTEAHPHWNQSPHALSSDATTRADFNGIINLRERDEGEGETCPDISDKAVASPPRSDADSKLESVSTASPTTIQATRHSSASRSSRLGLIHHANEVLAVLYRYAQFVGPGFLISVAYIDPGNYATDVAAGASVQYKLLFVVLMSNLFAIFLQCLCIKLGSVTGLNLAEHCRKHLPRWLNIVLYILAEIAIVATDMAEVIGSAIALNLLIHIPLVGGVALTVVDVLLLLLLYKPDGSMARLRVFEYFVMALVLGVMVCFCIQLSYIRNTTAGEVFKGYLPSSAVIDGNGIYLSCGILGATVMPHSIFLGSGIVQPRLRQFDDQGSSSTHPQTTTLGSEEKYKPSVSTIRTCLKYSIAELSTSLFTFALFVNSAILIVAGSSLYPSSSASNADLFGIHDLLSHDLAPAAGTIFALALLLSGTSAGIVCTMAGQMVSEGMLNWTLTPWVRRLVTRSISITPSIVIAASVGRSGLNTALTASQVVLSVILPFVTAPLIYFTCSTKFMTVSCQSHHSHNGHNDSSGRDPAATDHESSSPPVTISPSTISPSSSDRTEERPPEATEAEGGSGSVNMRNGWVVTTLAILIWLVLVIMNVALLVLVGLGKA